MGPNNIAMKLSVLKLKHWSPFLLRNVFVFQGLYNIKTASGNLFLSLSLSLSLSLPSLF